MDVWVSLVNVVPAPGNDVLNGARGAYVNVAALASGPDAYQAIVQSEFSALEFSVISIEGVIRLSEILKNNTANGEILGMSDNVKKTGNIEFGVFHAYQIDEELN